MLDHTYPPQEMTRCAWVYLGRLSMNLTLAINVVVQYKWSFNMAYTPRFMIMMILCLWFIRHMWRYKNKHFVKSTKKTLVIFTQISEWTENTWCAGQNPSSSGEFLYPAMLVSFNPHSWPGWQHLHHPTFSSWQLQKACWRGCCPFLERQPSRCRRLL